MKSRFSILLKSVRRSKNVKKYIVRYDISCLDFVKLGDNPMKWFRKKTHKKLHTFTVQVKYLTDLNHNKPNTLSFNVL